MDFVAESGEQQKGASQNAISSRCQAVGETGV
jgi:hypothetical protein